MGHFLNGSGASDGGIFLGLCLALRRVLHTVSTVLRLSEYDGEDEGSWILLEPLPAGSDDAGPSGAEPEEAGA